MPTTDALILPSDVFLQPARELPDRTRGRLRCRTTDFVIGRPHSRSDGQVIDHWTFDLLMQFRRPKTIIEAVVSLAQAGRMDPDEILVSAYPMLEAMCRAGFLVPPESPDAEQIKASFTAGEPFAEFEIVAPVQVYSDVELYQARGDAGLCALKVSHRLSSPSASGALDRERRILEHLAGRGTPRLLAWGTRGGRAYLASSWCRGEPVDRVASTLRSTGCRDEVASLCAAVLDAYAELHGNGVVHSDVHPRNVLAGDMPRITIIDFGLGWVVGKGSIPRRGGVGFYYEPEFALAAARHAPLPPSTPLGEQYSVAALIYLLMTGYHYLEFSLDRMTLFRQIARGSPLPFEERGLEPWPEVETVLSTALAKDPSNRFRSMDELGESWRLAIQTRRGTHGPRIVGKRGIVEAVVDRLGLGSDLLHSGLLRSPRSSVAYGAAGIAYTLLRIASVRESPMLLAAAEAWLDRALAPSPDCYSTVLGVTSRRVGQISLYHGPPGIQIVAALLGRAIADPIRVQAAVDRFVHLSPTSKRLDITSGIAGTLLGCSVLLEGLDGMPDIGTSSLIQLGTRRVRRLWDSIDRLPPIRGCRAFPYLGVAHGWAGLLYATAAFCRATGVRPPATLIGRLAELRSLTRISNHGASWPIQGPEGIESQSWSGWCHGSAGYTHLWLMARDLLGDESYMALAEASAIDAWERRDGTASLCCGLAGQAYAAAALFETTGSPVWRERARQLASKAEDQSGLGSALRESLLKGQLGVALVCAELDGSQSAAMPLFGRVGRKQ